MLHAVIMAGGAGTRFWPESRRALPKQLLALAGRRTMLQATVDRLGDLVPLDRITVATTAALAPAIAAQLTELPREALLVEPCKRDTAACIGLAAARIARDDPDATMAVMPSDHVIRPDDAFRGAIRNAAELVECSRQRIVTFGIKPSYAAEIFGYIEPAGPLDDLPAGAAGAPHVYRVQHFREKPKGELAEKFFRAGFYWNSGIFVWRARTILDALATYAPSLHGRLMRIADAAGSPQFDEVLQREFSAIEPISIDYAVMEQAADVAVIEAPFEWDDLGSWQSLARIRGEDEAGNTVAAERHLGVATTGTIVRSSDPGHVIVTVGLDDCIVVHTPDATLIARKRDEEAIRQVVKLLEERGWDDCL